MKESNYVKKYTITGHMVVKNEDQWIWYAVMSVIDYLDKLLIYDTGSTDRTVDIILYLKNLYGPKIVFQEIGDVDTEYFYCVRQMQIDNTSTDYFMVVDGDEIWYKKGLEELNKILNDFHPLLVATKFINCCGDIYHYRYDKRESYMIDGEKGAVTIRVYSMNIPGISCGGEYGVEGFVNKDGVAVQEAGYKIIHMRNPYLHTSLLLRSSAHNGDYSILYRRKKLSAEWDQRFSKDFIYPEVFYIDRPHFVHDAFEKKTNFRRFLYSFYNNFKRFVKEVIIHE